MTVPTEAAAEGAAVEILKSDVLGRIWTSKEKREAMVAEFERSGMSALAFAKWSGVKYGTFAGWVQKVRRARRQIGEQTAEMAIPGREVMRWAEAVCEQPAGAVEAALVIRFGEGVQVEARNGRVAAELLTAMGVRTC